MSIQICIAEGAKWWGSLFKNEGLPGKLKRYFQKKLKELMFIKMKDHWFPGCPLKGQGFRSILIDTKECVDPLLEIASKDIFKLSDFLPSGTVSIVMWVDPGLVSVKTSRLYLDGKVRNSELEVFKCELNLNLWDYDMRTGLAISFEITSNQEHKSEPSKPSYSDKLKCGRKKKRVEQKEKKRVEECFPSLPSVPQQRDVPAVSDEVKLRYHLKSYLIISSDPIVEPSKPSYSDKLKWGKRVDEKEECFPSLHSAQQQSDVPLNCERKKKRVEQKEKEYFLFSLPSVQQQSDVPAVSDEVKERSILRSYLIECSDPTVDVPMEQSITYRDIESGLISLMEPNNLIKNPKEETEEDSRSIIVNEKERIISFDDQLEHSQTTNITNTVSCKNIGNGSTIPIQNNNVHHNEQSSPCIPLYSDKVKCKPSNK